MNPVMNLLLSLSVLIFAGVALYMTQSGGEAGNMPWMLLAGFIVGSLVFAVLSLRRQKGPAPVKKSGAKRS